MNKQKATLIRLIVLACGALLIVGLGAIWVFGVRATDTPASATITTQQPVDRVAYIGTKGLSILTQLRQVAQVETQTSSYGEYVTGINGLQGGTDGKYWTYYIDGKLATVGAASYTSIGGERVEWKFEK